MENSTQLTLINLSAKPGSIDLLCYQYMRGLLDGVRVMPWLLVHSLSYGFNHPFVFCRDIFAHLLDENGNCSPAIQVFPGQHYSISGRRSQQKLVSKGTTGTELIEFTNDLSKGSFQIVVCKRGIPILKSYHIVPGDYFEFTPSLELAFKHLHTPMSDQRIHRLIESPPASVINLFDVKSADILVVGGGIGVNAQGYGFVMENVVKY